MHTSSSPSFMIAFGRTFIPPPVQRPLPTSTSIASSSIRSSSTWIVNDAGENLESVFSNATTYVPVAPSLTVIPFAVSFTSESKPAPAMLMKFLLDRPRRDLDHVEVDGLRVGEQLDRGVELPGSDPLGEVVSGPGGERRQCRAGAEDAVGGERDGPVATERRHDLRSTLGRDASESLDVGAGFRDTDLVRQPEPVQCRGDLADQASRPPVSRRGVRDHHEAGGVGHRAYAPGIVGCRMMPAEASASV